jgi:hypothetical protein
MKMNEDLRVGDNGRRAFVKNGSLVLLGASLGLSHATASFGDDANVFTSADGHEIGVYYTIITKQP